MRCRATYYQAAVAQQRRCMRHGTLCYRLPTARRRQHTRHRAPCDQPTETNDSNGGWHSATSLDVTTHTDEWPPHVGNSIYGVGRFAASSMETERRQRHTWHRRYHSIKRLQPNDDGKSRTKRHASQNGCCTVAATNTAQNISLHRFIDYEDRSAASKRHKTRETPLHQSAAARWQRPLCSGTQHRKTAAAQRKQRA